MEGEVVSTDGDDMGEIEDVILSSTGRAPLGVLVETGGFWGMGQDYVPIALSRLHMIDDETYAVQIGSDPCWTSTALRRRRNRRRLRLGRRGRQLGG